MGGVEDRLPAAVVVDEDGGRCLRIRVPEAEDVAQRRAPEAVDALVVVPDDGDVAVRLRQQTDDLPLGVVRVLELVDEDVAVSRALLVKDRAMIAQQSEGEPDLVAEIEPVRGPHELLVGLVGGGQLGVPRCLLGQRLVLGRGRRPLGEVTGSGQVGLVARCPRPAADR